MDELPVHVLRGAHSRSVLRAAGIRRAELEGALWRSPYRGRYSWSLTDRNRPRQRILEAASVLPPDGAIAGWAAAYLHGVHDLDGRGWDGTLHPVLFALPCWRRVERPGLLTIRAPLPDDDVCSLPGGIQVTAPERTCFDLMRLSPTLATALVAVDAMLRAEAVRLDALFDYVRTHTGWKGVRQVREALDLADDRAASCSESLLRVAWVVDARLPRPLVHVPVYDPAGWFLGEADLADEQTGLVAAYNRHTVDHAADHAANHEADHAADHEADRVRQERLENHNLTVVRVATGDVVRQRRTLVARLQLGYQRARRRSREHDRWTFAPPQGRPVDLFPGGVSCSE